jgi:hypothetical protein
MNPKLDTTFTCTKPIATTGGAMSWLGWMDLEIDHNHSSEDLRERLEFSILIRLGGQIK